MGQDQFQPQSWPSSLPARSSGPWFPVIPAGPRHGWPRVWGAEGVTCCCLPSGRPHLGCRMPQQGLGSSCGLPTWFSDSPTSDHPGCA